MIQSVRIDELTDAQRARLDDLTHGEEGNLLADLRYYHKNPAMAAVDDLIVHLAYAEGIIVGWAMQYLCDDTARSPLDVGIFVDEGHRRQGVGTALMRRAMEHAGPRPVYVFPDDIEGRAFFSNFNVKQMS